ncbi:MAG: hypothetical protein M0C28_03540 [Candidatus Moduliflexus flocculans]|nr:hypothetical protein [Candidatus Moduliflexus flocculans]
MIDHAKKQYSEMPLDFDKMFGAAAGEEGWRRGGQGPSQGHGRHDEGPDGQHVRPGDRHRRERRRSATGTAASTPSSSTWAAWARPRARRGPPRRSRSTTPWPTPWPTA